MKRVRFSTVFRLIFAAILVTAILSPTNLAQALVRLDPYLALAALWGGAGFFACLCSAAVLIASMFKRRFYCRFFCPAGLALDGARLCARAALRVSVRPKPLKKRWRFMGYVLLAAGGTALIFGSVGFLWLDPMAITLSLLNDILPTQGTAEKLGTLDTGVFRPLGIFALVILLETFFVPNFWCGTLCPCGALSDVLFALPRLIAGIFRKGPSPESVTPSRRRFFGRLARLGWLGEIAAISSALVVVFRQRTSAATRPFRPPGALDESRFLSRCSGCGLCVRACPTGLIRPLKTNSVPPITPTLDFNARFCDVQCRRCAEVCPTGAIALLPLEKKNAEKIAAVRFERESCRLWHDRECAVCRVECPFGAIQFVWNADEYLNLPQIDATKCSGCGKCAVRCPGIDGKKAFILVEPDL